MNAFTHDLTVLISVSPGVNPNTQGNRQPPLSLSRPRSFVSASVGGKGGTSVIVGGIVGVNVACGGGGVRDEAAGAIVVIGSVGSIGGSVVS
jgi:hypothetical protein